MIRILLFSLTMGIFLLQFQNCAQHNDPSLFSADAASTSTDPDTVILESPVGALDVSVYESMITLGGHCQTANSSSHYIELKLQDQSNIPIQLRSVTCPDCYTLVNARCEHGRYSAIVPIDCKAYRGSTSSLYRLVGQLVTRDAAGVETRQTTAAFDRFLQVAWLPGACP